MTRTGRPRAFVETTVVDGAKLLFWRRGFERTTMRDLSDEVGVLPGSLHASLGSKQALFMRGLRRYVDETSLAAAQLAASGSPIQEIRSLLEAVLESARSEPGRGCFLGNTAVEFLPQDEPVRDVVASGLRALEDGIESALARAQDRGEIREDVDCAAHARLLVALVQGLHVTARAEPDVRRLDDVIDAALDRL